MYSLSGQTDASCTIGRTDPRPGYTGSVRGGVRGGRSPTRTLRAGAGPEMHRRLNPRASGHASDRRATTRLCRPPGSPRRGRIRGRRRTRLRAGFSRSAASTAQPGSIGRHSGDEDETSCQRVLIDPRVSARAPPGSPAVPDREQVTADGMNACGDDRNSVAAEVRVR